MAAVDPAAMRRINSSSTLRSLFQARGALTMAQLTERTGLSRRTIELILDELIAEEWVREVSPAGPTGVGRPARSYEFRAENALFGAIQLDTHAASAAVVDSRGRILARRSRVLSDSGDAALTVREGGDLLQATMRTSRLPIAKFRAIGMATGGMVDDAGTVLELIGAPDWTGYAPGRELSARFGLPVVVDNDANLAALGEQWVGAARDQPTLAWLLAGVRSGAGIVIQGEIHRGFRSAAGEIVHVESFGVAEQRSNPIGMVSSPVPEQREEALGLLAAAHAGDHAASELLDRFLVPVTRILIAFAWTLAPPLIVLGGAGADLLVVPLRERLLAAGAPPIELRATGLGQDAPLLGAVRAARDSAAVDPLGALAEEHLRAPGVAAS